jgi:N-acetylglutamate synthase-like GNAT family acetyltransferase
MIQIARYAEGHGEGVRTLILGIQQREFGLPLGLEAQPDLIDIRRAYGRGASNFWVALAGGEVVGSIALLDIGNRDGALRKMFVKAPFRGARHGVARRLLDGLLAWAEIQLLRRIYLGTHEKLVAAHRFYEKNGFRRIERRELPAAFPVMAVDTMFYRLDLAGG